MVQRWSPLSEVSTTPNRDEWIMYDGAKRIAIMRLLELGPGKSRVRVIRAVTWDVDPTRRTLIGYFPSLRFAADITWAEWKRSQGIAVPPLLDLD